MKINFKIGLLGILILGIFIAYILSSNRPVEVAEVEKRITDSSTSIDSVNTVDQTIPSNLSKILIKDIEVFCLDFKEGKATTSTLISLDQAILRTQQTDLNADGDNEIIVYPERVCDSSPRGVSGNGPIYIYAQKRNEWQKIGNLEGNSYKITDQQVNEYNLIKTYWHESASSGIEATYTWEPVTNLYIQSTSTHIQHD